MIWFTADEHFNHKNIIEYCNRPFISVEEMNALLVYNFNSVVGEKDETYHLGDFAFARNPNQFLKLLNGKHYLVKGNHDHKNVTGQFNWVKDTHKFNYDKRAIFLSHYAHRSWPNQHHGCIHLYGHSHGTLVPALPNSMDVGVDTNNYFPYSVEEIFSLLPYNTSNERFPN